MVQSDFRSLHQILSEPRPVGHLSILDCTINITVPGSPVASGWRCDKFQRAVDGESLGYKQNDRGGATETGTAYCLNRLCIGNVYHDHNPSKPSDVPPAN